jgi:long-chain fatty acid transport protein
LAPAPGEVCADVLPLPTPQLAASVRLHQRVAVGLGLVAPHAPASMSWPATIVYADRYGETDHPSPTRYLLVESDNLLFYPTLAAAVAVSRELSFGVGFVWGIASLDFSSMAESVSPTRPASQPDEFAHDVLAEVSGTDGFVPGLVASVLWSPSERVDLAGWFRWSDAVRSSVDLKTTSSYYTLGGRINEGAIGDPTNITEVADAGTFRLPIPMEAKLGFRYRHPRADALPRQWALEHEGWVRDPLGTEWFDVEIDLTWAHNSEIDALELRFRPGIQIAPTTGLVPQNADVPHGFRDALGVRIGGDYVVLPDLLALRIGGFFESSSANPGSLHLDFHPSEKVGLGAGGTVRLGSFDVSLAYQHTFFGAIDNAGRGTTRAISGDRTTGQRSRQVVNGGRATASLDELALGAAVHF